MRPKKLHEKTAARSRSLVLHLAGQAVMGSTLGFLFCILVALINPSDVTALIAHNAEPGTTATILVSFFVLIFGIGATLTGIVLAMFERH